MTKIKLPTTLAYSKKILNSNALMFAKTEQGLQPINVATKGILGTQSYYGADDKNKAADANLQKVDFAELPLDSDTLVVKYNVKFLGDIFTAEMSGDETVPQQIADKVEGVDYHTLAYRYVYNIASGRTLWRNRVGADEVTTTVKVGEEEFIFDSFDLPMNDWDDNDCITYLADKVAQVFANGSFVMLEVEHEVVLGAGMPVYPSEEFVEDTSKTKKSKTLFDINGQAAMHDVKIGNAIRTIDDWYEDSLKPIAVEPFGSVPKMGQAHRAKVGGFFKLLEGKSPLNDNEKLFVTSVLIRGGVFGGK
ncbi:CRISPR-associated protein [Vibrio phage 1.161.O._10N.261.48.C5]|nr:CRISPR-associated protein [Vibrio phage 1.161.O._10N.261.48.C5]